MLLLQFVTRAVRVIDLMTNTDMQSFEVHGGLNTFINRLEVSISIMSILTAIPIIERIIFLLN
jgi:hypothetical protein